VEEEKEEGQRIESNQLVFSNQLTFKGNPANEERAETITEKEFQKARTRCKEIGVQPGENQVAREKRGGGEIVYARRRRLKLDKRATAVEEKKKIKQKKKRATVVGGLPKTGKERNREKMQLNRQMAKLETRKKTSTAFPEEGKGTKTDY